VKFNAITAAFTATSPGMAGKVLMYRRVWPHHTSALAILGDFGQIHTSGTGDKDLALCLRYLDKM